MEKGRYQTIAGQKVFIELGKNISKQIIEQLKEPKEIKITQQSEIKDYRKKVNRRKK